ncbi:MAG: lipase maturation factor family protein [Phycisphaeraceae bacterium]|nr:lipase maturation factor family protein [Phycisphaeraceae bacterium]
MSTPRRDDESAIPLDAPRPEWAQKPLPDIVPTEEEVRLPGGSAERLYIPPSPPWVRGREWFLRGIGVTYVVAFASLAVQARGLLGPRGLAPIEAAVKSLDEQGVGQLAWPSLFRVLPTMAHSPETLAWIGAGFGLLMIVGLLPPLAALGAWLCYLSFVTLGAPFLSFQWDSLLLESGVLALLASPWTWALGRGRAKPVLPLLRWCLWFLIGRLMLLSGLVKLVSGSLPWRDGTALDFHWWTQPLPNPVSWWLGQMPLACDRIMTFGSLAIEFAVPLLILLGRWPRAIAALLVLLLQGGIALSGNYGFFNLLTAVLALSLVDDEVLRRLLRRPLNVPIPLVPSSFARTMRWCGAGSAVAVALLVALPSSVMWLERVSGRGAGPFDALPSWVGRMLEVPLEAGMRWRLASGYGLFADMTTTRPELAVEVTLDGRNWEPVIFRWKPGPLDRAPPLALLHMPRLDWQMWFAALAFPRGEAWQAELERAILEGRPEVLALLDRVPLGGARPRAVRWRRDLYEFSTLGSAEARGGAWWIVSEIGRGGGSFLRR